MPSGSEGYCLTSLIIVWAFCIGYGSSVKAKLNDIEASRAGQRLNRQNAVIRNLGSDPPVLFKAFQNLP